MTLQGAFNFLKDTASFSVNLPLIVYEEFESLYTVRGGQISVGESGNFCTSR